MCQGERKQRPRVLSLQNQNVTPTINSGYISFIDGGFLSIDHLVLYGFIVCLCVTELGRHSQHFLALCSACDLAHISL